jgi:hypothetical protein
MVIALASTALAGGLVSTEVISSSGPDLYATVRVTATGGPGLSVGALILGGTQPAWLATAGRTFALGDHVDLTGELDLGMLRRTPRNGRQEGPTAGFGTGLTVDAGPVDAVAELAFVSGVGTRAETGIDAPLGWLELSPRVRLETWSGDRDPALRVSLGARHETSAGWWASIAVSAGGRDVIHMGPGVAVAFGRAS